MGETDWGAWTLNVYSNKILTQKSKYTRWEREKYVECMVVESRSRSKLRSSEVNNQQSKQWHHSTIPVCTPELNEQCVVEEKNTMNSEKDSSIPWNGDSHRHTSSFVVKRIKPKKVKRIIVYLVAN